MYYTYVVSNDSTMLPRFFGLVRINLASGSKQRLVLMNNLLPERYRFERYDLKGSSLGRAATAKERSDPLGVRKDRDFEQKLRVPDDMLALLAEQLHKDSAWLEKLRVMDYSLLVGLNWPNRQSELELRPCADLDPSGPDTDDEPWEECQSIPAAVYQQYGPAAAHGIPGGPKKGRGGFYAVGPPGAFEPDGEIWQRLRPWIEVDGKSPENWFDQYPNCGGADGDGVGMEGGSRTPTGEDADELGDLSAQTDDSNDDEAIVKAIVKGPQKARSRLRSLAPGRPASALAGRRSNTVPPPLHSANTNGHGNGWTGGSLGPVRATTLGQV
ncbi:hypothetical protein T492DRAFT_221489 [Pavlovales sp. CCMP2436]|nr:hypothetical protein T492DRAFT_221489 [Pavlovales sp. CCMP2436]